MSIEHRPEIESGVLSRSKSRILVWTLLGCVVFGAAGFHLVANAWGGTSPIVRAQSPEDRTKEPVPSAEADNEATQSGPAASSDARSLMLLLCVFVLAIFVGFEIITKVPPTLHTPLMSGSNAISGITLVGAMIVAGAGWGFSSVLGMLAVALAMINVVGGFLVTHRMLAMFQAKKKK